MSSQQYGFGMPFKNPYMTQSQLAIGRAMFQRTTPFVAEKQFKTQNRSTGSYGRLNALKTQAARSSVAVNGVDPVFKDVDRNLVNASLTRARNIGGAVPRNAIPQ